MRNCSPSQTVSRSSRPPSIEIGTEQELPVSRSLAAKEVLKRRTIRQSLIEWGWYKGFEAAPHHRLICDEIDRFLAGDDEVLLLFSPPGSAKSTWLSVLFPSYYLARFPKNSILAATHSVERPALGPARP